MLELEVSRAVEKIDLSILLKNCLLFWVAYFHILAVLVVIVGILCYLVIVTSVCVSVCVCVYVCVCVCVCLISAQSDGHISCIYTCLRNAIYL